MISIFLRSVLVASAFSLVTAPLPAHAQTGGIEQLLIERVAIPQPRPGNRATGTSSRPVKPALITNAVSPVVSGNSGTKVTAMRGSLREGLDAISNKKIDKARAIRAGLQSGSLDRKILAWALAISGGAAMPSSDISKISRDLSAWPGKRAMRINSEAALARENPSARVVVNAFGKRRPESLTGAILLAKSHLALGNRKSAYAIIAPFWRGKKMSKKSEAEIVAKLGAVLGVTDYRARMHYLFYRGDTKGANRLASRAEQVSLAKARTAVVRRAKDANKKLNAVAPSSRRDAGYLFARIQYLRRAEKYRAAAKLLNSAPRDAKILVSGNQWWVERRIISRAVLDMGDAALAYKLAAEHSATTPAKRVEAEFHAGWYALRFLKNRKLARKHFENIVKISKNPISIARGNYWLARASSGGRAAEYYQVAARHKGTYYGQLAAVKLGKRALSVGAARPTNTDKTQLRRRELMRAIVRLEASNASWRADILYRHLARQLASAGEISLLAARAQKQGKRKLALQIGKTAYSRGMSVMNLSWPVGAIPQSAKINKSNRALAYSIARQESGFDTGAVSGANARGLLQLLPGTAKLMAKKTGVAYSYKKLTRDPAYNARLGAAYLSEQLTNFDGSYVLTFVGYNAGPSRAKQWIAKYGDPRGKPLDQVIDWVERIPFTETRNYVQRVMENMQVYKARIGRSRLEIDRDLVRGRS